MKANSVHTLFTTPYLKNVPEESINDDSPEHIIAVLCEAFATRRLSAEDVQILQEANLLKDSTIFRSSALYPGEKYLLRFDYTDRGVKHSGILGFDAGLALISVDERLPKARAIYLGSRADQPAPQLVALPKPEPINLRHGKRIVD